MPKQFRFAPRPPASSAGVCVTPLTGEVEIGRTYEYDDPQIIAALRQSPDWEEVSEQTGEEQ